MLRRAARAPTISKNIDLSLSNALSLRVHSLHLKAMKIKQNKACEVRIEH